jgi:sugar (pentulose or hexulose) kinase
VILTLDLGTSVTKAALWAPDGLVGLAEVTLATLHPGPGRAEQDATGWWSSVVAACAALGASDPGRLRAVTAVGCTGARQSFGLFDAGGSAVGPGILWSDRRAGAEAGRLPPGDGSGPPRDGASVPAKLAWVAAHRPADLACCSWVLAPRDLVAWRLSGTVATDATMASLTGCYRADGAVDAGVAGAAAGRLPPVVAPATVTGTVGGAVAGELGLRTGIPVVIGAGDRQSEVVGTGATPAMPMVSWGTTANVSLPVDDPPVPAPAGVVVTRAAGDGRLLEGGLSAAGSLLAWLGRTTGRTPAELADLAATRPPGADGVTAVPWLGGARAPWWRPGAGAAFVGLADRHGPADLARAVVEAVARDVQRCLAAMAERHPAGPVPIALGLAGGGAATGTWVAVLTGTTGLPAQRRRSGQAASAGAALLVSRAVGERWDLDTVDPVVASVDPDPAGVSAYAGLRPHHDAVAAALVDLEAPPCG